MPLNPSNLFGAGPQHVVRAIQTTYKQYKFRSRLEARYAVFFDALGLQWEYEPEGYDLGDGVWYLPDFRVKTPQGEDIWYEIKPLGNRDDVKFAKFKEKLPEISRYIETGRAEILDGDPVDMLGRADFCPRCWMFTLPEKSAVFWGVVSWAGGHSCDERSIGCPQCDAETPSGGDEPIEFIMGYPVRPHKGAIAISGASFSFLKAWELDTAAAKARAARFEHGETP